MYLFSFGRFIFSVLLSILFAVGCLIPAKILNLDSEIKGIYKYIFLYGVISYSVFLYIIFTFGIGLSFGIDIGTVLTVILFIFLIYADAFLLKKKYIDEKIPYFKISVFINTFILLVFFVLRGVLLK